MKKPRLNQNHMRQLYEDNKYMIWGYDTLYQINYSQAQKRFYIMKIYRKQTPSGAAKRGWFKAMTPEEANQF